MRRVFRTLLFLGFIGGVVTAVRRKLSPPAGEEYPPPPTPPPSRTEPTPAVEPASSAEASAGEAQSHPTSEGSGEPGTLEMKAPSPAAHQQLRPQVENDESAVTSEPQEPTDAGGTEPSAQA